MVNSFDIKGHSREQYRRQSQTAHLYHEEFATSSKKTKEKKNLPENHFLLQYKLVWFKIGSKGKFCFVQEWKVYSNNSLKPAGSAIRIVFRFNKSSE